MSFHLDVELWERYAIDCRSYFLKGNLIFYVVGSILSLRPSI